MKSLEMDQRMYKGEELTRYEKHALATSRCFRLPDLKRGSSLVNRSSQASDRKEGLPENLVHREDERYASGCWSGVHVWQSNEGRRESRLCAALHLFVHALELANSLLASNLGPYVPWPRENYLTVMRRIFQAQSVSSDLGQY